MRVWIGAVMVSMVMAGAVAACDQPAGAGALRDGLASWINEVRRDKGLTALRDSGALEQAAAGHACDMAHRNYFAHEGPGGPGFATRIKRTGYRFRGANENIANTREASVSAVASVWRNSTMHWANIMDPAMRDMGLGIATAHGKVYWVMNTGRPKG